MSTTDKIPCHIAIIMDGNGRWAKERGKERYEGHRQGVESVRTILKSARNKGVKYLTLYVFSTENWGRPQEEVDMLMELLCKSIINEMDDLKKEGVRVRIIGDKNTLPENVQKHILEIENETSSENTINLQLALNYSARAEMVRAVRLLAEEVSFGRMTASQISADSISEYLYTNTLPEPDLIIRTGGEQRLSNFLLWQGAYSELYFTPTYWPDFDENAFNEAIAEYSRRERRFGLVPNK